MVQHFGCTNNMLFNFLSSIGFTLLLPALIVADGNSVDQVIIKNTFNQCITRKTEAGETGLSIGPIGQLMVEHPESIIWQWTPEGRLISLNGRCLTGIDGNLSVGECATSANTIDWDVLDDQKLRFGKNWCLHSSKKANDIPQLSACSSEDTEKTWFYVESLKLNKQNNETAAYERSMTRNEIVEGLDQAILLDVDLRQKLQTLSENIDDLRQEGQHVSELERTISAQGEAINKKLQLVNSLNSFGTSILAEVKETERSPLLASYPLETIAINDSFYDKNKLSNIGPLTVSLVAHISAPSEGWYSFVLKGRGPKLVVYHDGSEILTKPASLKETSSRSPAVFLSPTDPYSLRITSSASLTRPVFSLGWTSTSMTDPVIPSVFVSSAVDSETCAMSTQSVIDCTTKFRDVATSEFASVDCPPGCTASQGGHFEKDFLLDSSICEAALVKGFISSHGGSVLIRRGIDRTAPLPETQERGFIDSELQRDGTSLPITDVTLVTKDEYLQSLANYDGHEGFASDDMDVLLLSQRTPGKAPIENISLSCHNSEKNQGLHDNIGFVATRTLDPTKPVIREAFLTKGEVDASNLIVLGFSKQTCISKRGAVALYTRKEVMPFVYQYPSMRISCSAKFRDPLIMNNSLGMVTVRCPADCTRQPETVQGIKTYSSESHVCASAIHAGVLSPNGGVVAITKFSGMMPLLSYESSRNGIHATHGDKRLGEAFYVARPTGHSCHYPATFLSEGGQRAMETNRTAETKLPHIGTEAQMTSYDRTDLNKLNSFTEQFQSILNMASDSATYDHPPANDPVLEESSARTVNGELNSILAIEKKSSDLQNKLALTHEGIDAIKPLLERLSSSQKKRTMMTKAHASRMESFETRLSGQMAALERDIALLEGKITNDHITINAANPQPLSSSHLDDNFVTYDFIDIEGGPSKWELLKNSNGRSSMLVMSSYVTSHSLVGTMALQKKSFSSEGSVSVDILMPPVEAVAAVIVQFIDSSNYTSIGLTSSKTAWIKRTVDGITGTEYPLVTCNYPSGKWIPVEVKYGPKGVVVYVEGQHLIAHEGRYGTRAGLVGVGANLNSSFGSVGFSNFSSTPNFQDDSLEASPKLVASDQQTVVVGLHNVHNDPVHPKCRLLNEKVSSLTSNLNNWMAPQKSQWMLNTAENLITGSNISQEDPMSSIMILKDCESPDYGDLALKYDLRQKAMSAAGVVTRARDASNFYLVANGFVDRSNELVSLVRVVDNRPTVLATCTPRVQLEGDWKTVKVVDTGDVLTVMINDEKCLEASVPLKEAAGGLGLIVEHGTADFRNFGLSS